MLNRLCCKLSTCTNSCFSTRAQLNFSGMSLGEASATILPAQAPTVPTYGSPTMRALNQPWPPVLRERLKISNSDFPSGSKPYFLQSSG